MNLFFDCDGGHRDVHSCPTRRSADLRTVTVEKIVPQGGTWAVTAAATPFRRITVRVSFTENGRARPLAEASRIVCHARSEEHTSELQSRQYLVCRLLLEKKKNTHIYS